MIRSTDKDISSKLLKMWGMSLNISNIEDTTEPRIYTWQAARREFTEYLKLHNVSKDRQDAVLRYISETGPIEGAEYMLGYVMMKHSPAITSIRLIRLVSKLLSDILEDTLWIDWTPIEDSGPSDFEHIKSWGRLLVRKIDEGSVMEDKMEQYYINMYITKGIRAVVKDIVKTAACIPTSGEEPDSYLRFIRVWSEMYGNATVSLSSEERQILEEHNALVITKLWNEPLMCWHPTTYSGVARSIRQLLYSSGKPALSRADVDNWFKQNSTDEQQGCCLLAALIYTSGCRVSTIADKMWDVTDYCIKNNIPANLQEITPDAGMSTIDDYIRFGKSLLKL